MGLGYKPSKEAHENSRPALKSGKFKFKVSGAEEKFFKTGTEGLKVSLLVSYRGRDIKCFVNLFYAEKAQWKLKAFLDCIGLDFDDPPEVHQLEDKTGMASFKVNEDGYFEVGSFLDPVEQTKEFNKQPTSNGMGKSATKDGDDFSYGPPPMDTGDVPF